MTASKAPGANAVLIQTGRLFVRHSRVLGVIAVLWFWTGIALYAEFLTLPAALKPLREPYFWTSVAANALWWGWLRSALHKWGDADQEPANITENSP